MQRLKQSTEEIGPVQGHFPERVADRQEDPTTERATDLSVQVEVATRPAVGSREVDREHSKDPVAQLTLLWEALRDFLLSNLLKDEFSADVVTEVLAALCGTVGKVLPEFTMGTGVVVYGLGFPRGTATLIEILTAFYLISDQPRALAKTDAALLRGLAFRETLARCEVPANQ